LGYAGNAIGVARQVGIEVYLRKQLRPLQAIGLVGYFVIVVVKLRVDAVLLGELNGIVKREGLLGNGYAPNKH
jgi:hypothetical protein